MSRSQVFFSTDAKKRAEGEDIQKKVKEASEKVKKERAAEASKVKATQETPNEEIKVVKKEECFTTVAGPDGKEVTIQTKPVDSNGKQPVEEKVLKLVDEVLALNFVQISQFTRLIKERLGLPDVLAAPVAAAPVAAAPAVGGTSDAGGAAPAAAAGEKKEKKTANVKLVKYDAKDKIKIIKEVRGLLGLGLKESKTMVESVPVVLKENMPKAEAEALVAKLKELGAETVLE
ncbi:ribosomal protein L7 [Blastocystis sp. subtype 4]|uniref:ribosomal protein L7 n=1 Tax=Blastocystis sp. subtype 4 TaxID=944170 RepID=UPI0007120EBE|nr:ribosomal protein L7 [Blastocystis sp. subtype 4]KNB44577.1 ribosomal protein L7 [Blastocystis sp. subtype 4]|eukprot:XP_014528018.1 ribosomal protein L7 [Blastocystis sp. subtype 4]